AITRSCSQHPIYFLTTPPPPSSPLFPYTTLFRSHPQGVDPAQRVRERTGDALRHRHYPRAADPGQQHEHELDHDPGQPDRQQGRSEEHTSELQSRENLVCRLLLEKKETFDKSAVH